MFEQIYIIHYEPNIDRKNYILDNHFFRSERIVWNTSYQTLDSIPKNVEFSITPKEMCVFLAHQEVLTDVHNKGLKSFLIIEDDALVNDIPDIERFFNSCQKEFTDGDSDMAFLAEAPEQWNMKVGNPILDKFLYTDVPQKSIASHCYTVKLDKIPDILTNFQYHLPIDHEYNRLISTIPLKVAWSYPGLKQGTHTNKYQSNIR
mgnify:CR=1 FL=1